MLETRSTWFFWITLDFACTRRYMCLLRQSMIPRNLRTRTGKEIISLLVAELPTKGKQRWGTREEWEEVREGRPEEGIQQDVRTSFRHCVYTGTVGKLPHLETPSATTTPFSRDSRIAPFMNIPFAPRVRENCVFFNPLSCERWLISPLERRGNSNSHHLFQRR